MHIIELRASNFKRLRAVEVRPDGAVVEITGANGAGKTSTLDAIWTGLMGPKVAPPVPIRLGAEQAIIHLDLGDLKVTRKFTAKEGGEYTHSLKVENAAGTQQGRPQDVLDALVGKLTFDPLNFMRQPAKDQYESLKQLTGLDFTATEQANAKDFASRTDVKRRAEDLRARAAAIVLPAGKLPKAVDLAALETKLADAAETNGEIERRRHAREVAEQRITDIQATITRLTEEMHGIQTRLAAAAALPTPVDVSEVREQLAAGRLSNAAVTKAREREAIEKEATEQEAEAKRLTDAIKARDDAKREKIAGASMPVAGLDFGDGLVLLNGVPFEQASDAEQLRASVAIAGAMNTELRIIRIRDGSLLDKKSWALLSKFAEDHDLQIWVESVESSRPGAIVIEDGQLADEGGEAI